MIHNLSKYILFKVVIFMLFCSLSQNLLAQLKANFSAIPTLGCTPLIVSFSDASTGNPTSWKWNWGIGTSLLQNPSATFFAPGQYTVKLTVSNSSGTDSIIKVQYITVNASPTVIFSGTPLTSCSVPLSVQFTDQSIAGSGNIVSWEWDFGDGFLSSAQNPQHTYTNLGNYNVTLRITNSFGCFKTLAKTNYIKLSGVQSDFTNTSPATCVAPVTINFQNLSIGGLGTLTYQWLFGDGGTSTAANPSHVYNTTGSYTVTLITTSSFGCSDTLVKPNAVVFGSQPNFSIPPVVCALTPISIGNTSIPTPTSSFWDFGDGTNSNVYNPVKTYSIPGVYSIRLDANFAGCSNSVTKSITVLSKSIANFNADILGSCKAPLTVNFTSNSPGATSYKWTFGDGGTSTAANPSYTYSTLGIYDVKLIVTNAGGCSDTLFKKSYIKIQPVTVTIPDLPDEGCAPLTHNFTTNVVSVDAVASYQWDFGDGNTSTSPNPSHTYPNPGNYTITVTVTTVTGCNGTATFLAGIKTGVKPIANFIANPRNVCADTLVEFTDLSTGNHDKWLWSFGDGGTAFSGNPEHKYTDTGYMTVTLIVWDNGCADSKTIVDYIHITPPIAIFRDTFTCEFPNQRQFIDSSIGADTHLWNFGDPGSGAQNTSTLINPSHTFTAAGTYMVSLTVRNDSTGCSFTKINPVNVLADKANFIATDTAICTRDSTILQIQNIDTANIVSYLWDFGDGTIFLDSTGTVTHIYNTKGRYSVSLVITSIYGCKDTLVKTNYIYVGNPIADFAATTQGACLSSPLMTFNDNTIVDPAHPITEWIVNYGDGVIDTVHSTLFQHSYTAEGLYGISVKVKDNEGCVDSTIKTDYIRITKPIANFSTNDTIPCPGYPVVFKDSSIGIVLTYLWDFGDGTTSTSPTHQYSTNGIYTVKLIIKDYFGCIDSMVKKSYITVKSTKADFTLSDTLSTCPPLVVKFTNQSTDYTSFTWDFGDGTTSKLDTPTHFYSSTGIFNVKLIAISQGGCMDVKTRQIVIRGPRGSLSYSNLRGCIPYQTNFTVHTPDKLSFIWDFNDGTTIKTTDTTISHTYVNAESYLPKIILVDPNGCQVAIIGSDSIYALDVTARYTINRFILCDSGFVNFNNTSISNDSIVSYTWIFGDGDSSNLENPTHYYKASGIYNTSLKVITQTGCTDTVSATVPIKAVQSPDIGIIGDSTVCVPAMLTFSGQILRPDTSAITWKWTFGNSQVSTLQNPAPQSYPLAGTYQVQAIATNSNGCKDTATTILQAHPSPIVITNPDTLICQGNSITLNTSGAAAYSWSPGTGLSCINCANPIATPDSNMKYIVTGTSSFGCIAKDSVLLTVKQPFIIEINPLDTLCLDRSIKLNASGAELYTWSPPTGLSNPNISNPTASPQQSTNYTVIGTDKAGCFKDTAFVGITVYPYPTVNAGLDTTIIIGQSVHLVPTISNDVINVIWSPSNSIASYLYPGIIARPFANTEYTVEVSNIGKCKVSDRVTIFVICNNMSAFIPNTFSPNGDGVNDIFYVRGTGIFRIKTLRIFNRWGEVVFESSNTYPNDASSGWNGTFKGQKLTPDVFVYMVDILCENNAILSYKGNVTLIK